MSKLKNPVRQPAPGASLIQRQDAGRQYIGEQEQSNKWKPLLTSVPIRFMEIRTGKCRWPIGDPHLLDSFRFCGCACASDAVYCDEHKEMAFTPSRPRMSVPSKKPLFPRDQVVARKAPSIA